MVSLRRKYTLILTGRTVSAFLHQENNKLLFSFMNSFYFMNRRAVVHPKAFFLVNLVPMIASGLLNFRRCCALRLEGKSQVGIIPICVSSDLIETSQAKERA